jgi:hypothetical protein
MTLTLTLSFLCRVAIQNDVTLIDLTFDLFNTAGSSLASYARGAVPLPAPSKVHMSPIYADMSLATGSTVSAIPISIPNMFLGGAALIATATAVNMGASPVTFSFAVSGSCSLQAPGGAASWEVTCVDNALDSTNYVIGSLTVAANLSATTSSNLRPQILLEYHMSENHVPRYLYASGLIYINPMMAIAGPTVTPPVSPRRQVPPTPTGFTLTSWAAGDIIVLSVNTPDLILSADAVRLSVVGDTCALPLPVFSAVQGTLTYTLLAACAKVITFSFTNSAVFRPTSDLAISPVVTARVLRFTAGVTHLLETAVVNLTVGGNAVAGLTPGGPVDAGKSQTLELTLSINATSTTQFLSRFDTIRIELPGAFASVDPPYLRVGGAPTVPLRLGTESASSPSTLMLVAEVDSAVVLDSPVVLVFPRAEVQINAPAGTATATVTIQTRGSSATLLESWSGAISVVAFAPTVPETRTAVSRVTGGSGAIYFFDFYFELKALNYYRSSPASYIVLEMNAEDKRLSSCDSATAVAYLAAGTVTMTQAACVFTGTLSRDAHTIRPGDTVRILMQNFITGSGADREPVSVRLETVVNGVRTIAQSASYANSANGGDGTVAPVIIFPYSYVWNPSKSGFNISFSISPESKPTNILVYFSEANLMPVDTTFTTNSGGSCNLTAGILSCTSVTSRTTYTFSTVVRPVYSARVDPLALTTSQLSTQAPYGLRVALPGSVSPQARGFLSTLPVLSQPTSITPAFGFDSGTGRIRLDLAVVTPEAAVGGATYWLVAPKALLGTSASVEPASGAPVGVTPADLPGSDLATPFIVQAMLNYSAASSVTFHLPDAGCVFGRHEVIRFTNGAREARFLDNVVTPPVLYPTRFLVGPSLTVFNPDVLSLRSGDTNPLPSGSGSLTHMLVWPNAAAVLFARDSSAVSYARDDLWRVSSSHGTFLSSPVHPVKDLGAALLCVLPSSDSRVIYAVLSSAQSSITVLSAATMQQLAVVNIATYVSQFASTGPISFIDHYSAGGAVGEQIIACAPDSCVVLSVDLDKFLFTRVDTLNGASATTRSTFPTFIGMARLTAASTARGAIRLLTSDGQIVMATDAGLVTVPVSGSSPSNSFVTIQSLPHRPPFSSSYFIAGDSYGRVRILLSGTSTITTRDVWTVPTCSGLCPIRQLRTTMPMLTGTVLDFYVLVLAADYKLYSVWISLDSATGSPSALSGLDTGIMSSGSNCLATNGLITHMDVASDNSNVYLGMSNGRVCTVTIAATPFGTVQTNRIVSSVPFGNIPPPSTSPTDIAGGSLVTYTLAFMSPVALRADDKVQVILPLGSFTTAPGFAVTGLPGVTPTIAPLDASASTLDTQSVATFVVPASYAATQSYAFSITNLTLSDIDVPRTAELRSSVTVRFATPDGVAIMSQTLRIGTLVFERDPFATIYPVMSRDSNAAHARTLVTMTINFHSTLAALVSLTHVSCEISNPSGAEFDTTDSQTPADLSVSSLPPSFTMSRTSSAPLFPDTNAATLIWTAKVFMRNPAPTMASTATVTCIGNNDVNYIWRSTVRMPAVYGPSSTALGAAAAIPAGLPADARISSVTASHDGSVFVAVTDKGHIFAYHASGSTYVPGSVTQPMPAGFTHVTGGRDLRYVYASSPTGDVYRFPRVMDTHGDSVYTKRDVYIAKSGIADHWLLNPLTQITNQFPQPSGTPQIVNRMRQLFTVEATPTVSSSAFGGFTFNPKIDSENVLGLASVSGRGLFGRTVVAGSISFSLSSAGPSFVSCFPWLNRVEGPDNLLRL